MNIDIEAITTLLENLRDEENCDVLDCIDDAANALESLIAEVERLREENNAITEAAENDMWETAGPAGICKVCKKYRTDACGPNKGCAGFEWRGERSGEND